MTLTEQWKKGELEQGEYWCKITESPYVERVYLPCCDDIIVEVLAPVPSYEEWRKMKEQIEVCAWALNKFAELLVKGELKRELKELDK
jgi:hypothetical protein